MLLPFRVPSNLFFPSVNFPLSDIYECRIGSNASRFSERRGFAGEPNASGKGATHYALKKGNDSGGVARVFLLPLPPTPPGFPINISFDCETDTSPANFPGESDAELIKFLLLTRKVVYADESLMLKT